MGLRLPLIREEFETMSKNQIKGGMTHRKERGGTHIQMYFNDADAGHIPRLVEALMKDGKHRTVKQLFVALVVGAATDEQIADAMRTVV